MKKTNVKPRPAGGVNKDIRVKVKTLEIDVTPKKKKKAVDDDEPVVKKKKRLTLDDEPRKKTLLLSNDVEPIKKKKLSKINAKNMKSHFGDGAEKILQLLDINETDSAVALIYKKTLSSLVDLLPYAEQAVRKSKGARGVYQINSLISSMREIMVDIQSAQDRGMMGQALMETVMKPSFKDIAQTMVEEYAMIGADAKLAIQDPQELNRFMTGLRESRTRLGASMNKTFKEINDNTIAYLQR